jgi:hypothetical protein
MNEVSANQEIRDLEGLVKELIEEHEDMSEVYLVHPPCVAELVMDIVNTDFEKHYTPYIRINTESGEIVRPLTMTLTLSGPDNPEAEWQTIIYTNDSVLGLDDRSPEEGLDILREKLDRESEDNLSKGDKE